MLSTLIADFLYINWYSEVNIK